MKKINLFLLIIVISLFSCGFSRTEREAKEKIKLDSSIKATKDETIRIQAIVDSLEMVVECITKLK